MTTGNLSFYSPPVPDLGEITCEPQETSRGDKGVLALVRLGPAGNLYLYEPEKARELLVAGIEALRILQPDAADEAVAALVADLLGGSDVQPDPYINAMAAEHPGCDETCPDTAAHRALTSVISADVQVCFWCGIEGTGMRQIKVVPEGLRWECADAEACRHGNAAYAAPDTAQPEDIPVLLDRATGCPECGAAG